MTTAGKATSSDGAAVPQYAYSRAVLVCRQNGSLYNPTLFSSSFFITTMCVAVEVLHPQMSFCYCAVTTSILLAGFFWIQSLGLSI